MSYNHFGWSSNDHACNQYYCKNKKHLVTCCACNQKFCDEHIAYEYCELGEHPLKLESIEGNTGADICLECLETIFDWYECQDCKNYV